MQIAVIIVVFTAQHGRQAFVAFNGDRLITHDSDVAAQADRSIHISDGVVTEVD